MEHSFRILFCAGENESICPQFTTAEALPQ